MLKKLLKIYNMKKFISIIVLSLFFLANVNAEERESELNNLFKQLKNSQTKKAIGIENKIWKIWSTHPSDDKEGYRLTELLDQGTLLINKRKLNKAYEIFTQIIATDPNWSEAWNKRALVLYLMKRHQSSLDDIKKTLSLEPRHFGALSGQGLVQAALKNYQKAIDSYIEAHKVHPFMKSPMIMIEKLQIELQKQSI